MEDLIMTQDRFSLDFSSAFDIFILDARIRRLSPRTLENYSYQIRRFVTWMEEEKGIFDIGGVKAVHVRGYLVHLQELGLSANTQYTAAKVIRTWFNFLVREEELSSSPMASMQMPRLGKKRPVIFTDEEVTKIMKAIGNRRDLALVAFLLDTGLRRAELVTLDVGDVDMTTGIVRVRSGKGEKDRSVFLGMHARYTMRRYLAERGNPPPDAPLWISETTGRGLTAAGVRMLLRRLRDKTGINHLTAHTFRRTCALWCLRSGMDVYQVAAIMGHADIGTLRHYLSFVESDLHDAHRRHSPMNGHMSKQRGRK